MSRVMGRRETEGVPVGRCSPGEADRAFCSRFHTCSVSLTWELVSKAECQSRPRLPESVF